MAKLIIKSIISVRLNINQTYYAVENLNNTRYDDLRKLMKQTSFKVKNLGGPIPKKNIPLSNKSLKSRILIHSKLNYDYQT